MPHEIRENGRILRNHTYSVHYTQMSEEERKQYWVNLKNLSTQDKKDVTDGVKSQQD